MKTDQYILKVSSQGQLTLPRALRERLRLRQGSKVVVRVNSDGEAVVTSSMPIVEYFGRYPGIASGGCDAAEVVREMRDATTDRRFSPEGQLPHDIL
jgi:AbrB family looped-hinge helix DNA binding protein